MRKRRLVITMGDPAGIGPEVIVKGLQKRRLQACAHVAVLGNRRVLEETCERLGVEFPFVVAAGDDLPWGNQPLLVQADRLRDAPVLPGKWSVRTGRASLAYILRAVEICRSGLADGMVTGPICKTALHRAGCRYPGHTELIADLTSAEKVVMMLIGGGLRVALVTTHTALGAVPQIATRGEIYGALMVTHQDLRTSFDLSLPRIGVLGLNPHAGEGGAIGQEEKVHIRPAIARARQKGVNASGPLPADTAFHRMLQGEFDVLVAMYHDQGLGPLKTLAFDSGVNITLGLPIVRTSVDHGTAFDIAGTGAASELSLVAAVETAARMARTRAHGKD